VRDPPIKALRDDEEQAMAPCESAVPAIGYFTLIETQARHILRCLRHARRRGATAVEVTEEANARYFAEMLRRRRHQVFWQASCGDANSYYFDRHGDAPLRPAWTFQAQRRAGRFPLDDYRWEGSVSASV
jgi:hypothetical protein